MNDSRAFDRGKLGILPLLTAVVFFSGCAGDNYMGVPLGAGTANPRLQELARRASAGDKVAQFDLGMLLEEGTMLPRNLKAAEHLYREAGRSSGGPRWVYVPGSSGGSGRVAYIDTVQAQPGLSEARRRLEEMQRRRGH